MSRRGRRDPGRVIPVGWDVEQPAAPSADEQLAHAQPGQPTALSDQVQGQPDQTQGQPDQAHAQPGQPKARPVQPPGRGRRVAAVLGAVALLVLAWAVLPALLFGEGPEDVAREYLDALVEGDVETAVQLSALPDGTGTGVMTDEIYAAATDRITSYRIDQVEVEGGTATVHVTTEAGGQERRGTLTLTSGSGGVLSPVKWSLDPVPPTELPVQLAQDFTQILVNGIPIDLEQLVQRTDPYGMGMALIPLLPGTYEVALPASGDIAVGVPMTVHALPTFTARPLPPLVLAHELTDAGLDVVQEQITDQLETCFEGADRPFRECPIQRPWRTAAPGEGQEEDRPASVTEDGALIPEDAPLGDDTANAVTLVELPTLTASPSYLGAFMIEGFGGIVEIAPTSDDADGHPAPVREEFEISAVAFIDEQGDLVTRLQHNEGGAQVVICLDAETGEQCDGFPVVEQDEQGSSEDG